MADDNHRATVSMAGEPYTATVDGNVVAHSEHAMILEEEKGGKAYPPVVYFPREDIVEDSLHATDHHSFCPIKGEASYFTVTADGKALVNAAWSYEKPLPQAGAVKNYIAFYPEKVSVDRTT